MSTLPNFDTLVQLAQENPLELERIRQNAIMELIEKAPEHSQKRLKGLQFQIDSQRQLHKNSPMGTCMAINKMMHESFAELCAWMNIITGKDKLDTPGELSEPDSNQLSAKVLPFNATEECASAS